MADPVPTNQEIAALKRQFDEQVTTLHDRIDEVEAQKNAAVRALDATAAELGISRRALLTAIGGAGGLSALGVFATQEARGAPQPSGGEGDFGSPGSPWEGWSDGLARVTQSVSSATTVTKHVIPYDCSVSGFTITIGEELEPQSGFATKVVLIDETGNAGSNAVTVDTESGNGIDGGSSITINHDHAVTTLYWDGSEWRSTRFIDSVDAGTVLATNVGTGANPIDSVDAGTVTADDLTLNDVLNTPPVTKTISSGSINVSDATYVALEGEGDSADNLDTMAGGSDGQIVILRANDTETITVRDGQVSPDEFFLDGGTNKTLDDQFTTLTLLYDPTLSGGAWMQIGFSSNV